jgi:hypothetical protein
MHALQSHFVTGKLSHKTKQGATSIVKFDWHISIIKTMFINNVPSCYVLAVTEQLII